MACNCHYDNIFMKQILGEAFGSMEVCYKIVKLFLFICVLSPTGLGGPVSGDCPPKQRLRAQQAARDDRLRLALPLVLWRRRNTKQKTHTPLPLILSSLCFYGYQEDSARPCVCDWENWSLWWGEKRQKFWFGWLTVLFYNLFTTECICCNTCLFVVVVIVIISGRFICVTL